MTTKITCAHPRGSSVIDYAVYGGKTEPVEAENLIQDQNWGSWEGLGHLGRHRLGRGGD